MCAVCFCAGVEEAVVSVDFISFLFFEIVISFYVL